MIRLGLCSEACITRDGAGVVALAAAAGLDAVEWSSERVSDLGDLKKAEELMMSTLRAGLSISSYSTLYQVGAEDEDFRRFEGFLRIAGTLQAPILRVFASGGAADDALRGSPEEREAALGEKLKAVGDRAAGKGICVCLSMGRGTYLDRYDRALRLVAAAAHDFVRLAWEDLPGSSAKEATSALVGAGRLAGLAEARCAGPDGGPRPVAAEAEAWRERLRAVKRAELDPKMGSFVLLGAPRAEGAEGETSLRADADALRAIVSEFEPKKAR